MLSQRIIDNAIANDAKVHGAMAEAARAYEDDFGKPSLRDSAADPKNEDSIEINLCKPAVNIGVNFLFGNSVDIQVDTDDETEEDKFLAGFWSENCQDQTLKDMAIVGAIHGHCFARLHAPYDEYEYPQIEVLNPQDVTVYRNPLNFRDILAYIITSSCANPNHDGKNCHTLQHQEVIEKNEAGTWTITKTVQEMGGFRQVMVESVEWPYRRSPIVHCKNLPSVNSFWGTADLSSDVIKANRQLNFAASNLRRVTRTQGSAKTFITGTESTGFPEDPTTGQKTINMSPDKVTLLETPIEIQQIPSAANLPELLQIVAATKEDFRLVAEIPEIAFGAVDLGANVSGITLATAYQSLVARTKTKHDLYGKLIQDISQLALMLGGYEGKYKIVLMWPPILPENIAEKLDAAMKKKSIGVSTSTILSELGYEAEVELKKSKEEREGLGVAVSEPE